jgi:NADPH2:quinone reductase
MKAAVLTGGRIEMREVPTPEPGPDEILVRVRATCLNRADLIVYSGGTHGAQGGDGTVLGMEWAGEVAATGADIKGFAAGDRVMCSGRGGFAEYAIAEAARISKMPEELSWAQGASFPVGIQTMHDAIVTHGKLVTGQSVLILGASSGVGLIGLQVAREMGAGLVIGSSTSPERRARLAEYGAALAIDSNDPAWPEQVREATGGKGVDLIVDLISGEQVNRALQAAAVLGRIVNVGRLGGQQGEIDFDLHALKRITYTGVTFRTRTADEVADIARRARAELWSSLIAQRLQVPIDSHFALADANQAFEHMRSNRHFGKIVLDV